MMIKNLNLKSIMNIITENNYLHSCSSTLYLPFSKYMKKALPAKEDEEDSEVQKFIKSFGMQVCNMIDAFHGLCI